MMEIADSASVPMVVFDGVARDPAGSLGFRPSLSVAGGRVPFCTNKPSHVSL